MVKYNIELKIKIVLEYLEKGCSSNYLCKKYNIKKRGTILYWVKLYQTYGLSGIKPMANHIIYTVECKQKVLHWMHTNHSSYPKTALQFKISPSPLLSESKYSLASIPCSKLFVLSHDLGAFGALDLNDIYESLESCL